MGDLTVRELLDGVVELLDAGTEYYTAVQTIIPIAATSEVVFTSFYERLVRRAGDPPTPTFLLGFDSAPIRAEKSLYDLAAWTRAHDDLTAALIATPSARVIELLDADEPPTSVDGTAWRQWRARFRAHLDRYGHAVYNLDFLNPVPADHPAPLLDTMRFYLSGGGADPHERQRRAAARREAQTAAVLARLDPLRLAVFVRLLRWAQGIAPVREDSLADIGLAWPQLRRMLHKLGRRLVDAAMIDRPDDVFWLHREEILGDPGARLAGVVDSARPSGGGSDGPRLRSYCRKAHGGRCSRVSCRRRRPSRPAMSSPARVQAEVRSPRRPACSPVRRTSAACNPETYWSPASPRQPGHHYSPWRPGSSPTSAAR